MKKASANFHVPSWLTELSGRGDSARLKLAERIILSLGQKNKEAANLVKSIKDRKEFIKPSLVPYFYYIPLNRTLDKRAIHLKFKKPMVGLKHKKLPLIMIVGESSAKSEDVVPLDYVETFGDFDGAPKHHLSYAKTLSKMDKKEKQALLKLSLDGLRSYRKENKKKDGWFSDYLESNKDFELVGFALNYSYINLDPKYGDTGPVWVHPWGLPSLLYRHKRNPVYMLTGPAHRLDENILGQTNMVGHTG